MVESLRGITWQSYDRSVDVLVSRLRNKLGDTTDKIKPDPEPINHALLLLNTKSSKNSFYVGDSKKDVRAAKAAKISSIACTFGYIEEGDDPEKWYADYLIDQPLEIIKIVAKR